MTVYSQEAKERIAKQGSAAISDFINSVPSNVRARCLARLPAMPGFRKNSQLELKEKYKKLVHTLSHTADPKFRTDGAEWSAFASIWVRRATSIFGEHNVQGGIPKDTVDEEAILTYFNGLVNCRGLDGCSQEELGPLYTFSGFPNSEGVEKLIKNLPLQQTLEQQRKLAKLPDEIEALSVRINQYESDSLKLREAIHAFNANIDTKPQTQHLQTEIQALGKQVSSVEQRLKEESQKANDSTSVILSRLSSTEQANGVSKTDIARLTKELSDLTAAHSTLQKSLLSVQQSFGELSDKLDTKLQEVRPLRRAADERQYDATVQSPALVSHTLKTGNAKPKRITDPISAVAHIASNFASVGVQAVEAEEIARVVLAAAAAGQLIQFKGSLGEVLALSACSSLGDGAYVSWNVPLGLCDGGEMRSVLQQIRSDTADAKCLLIRGINKSAFEIYGDDLRELVVARQLGINPEACSWPNLAVWSEGPATLPGSSQLTSLGPVVNSDNLQWGRSKWEKQRFAAMEFGAIAASLRQKADADELADLIGELEQTFPSTNQLRRRVLMSAASMLLALNNGDSASTFCHTATYWGVPWAVTMGLSRDEIEAATRRSLADGAESETMGRALNELESESAL